ncbi:MAG: glycosyltransferase family 2 protein [Candidatus Brocadia sp.]|uniref:Glycosyltransferase family 2 n=1 Tax=Candidatus Brocadia fulgida TaxID=380242 RepID=A0A0M2V2M4_9BACT|nr:MAG: glycosyltransferase family 2 [Candidatus Brocadia fulgida]UJS22470.1 MAG: glycosyltransferase family 2 protein [Candidatus Brocadia sp.]
MNKPTAPISVVIPCFRCAQTIQRSVDSVAAQTHLPKEVMLVDDASDDDTLNVIMKLQNRYDKNWIRVVKLEHNGGPSVARNTGWEVATQPFIAFLDADDAWHPRKLEIQFGWMLAHPHVAMTVHNCTVVLSGMPDLTLPDTWRATPVIPYRFLLFSGRDGFSTPSIIMRRNLPYRFEPMKRHSEDYLFKLQIVLDGNETWRLELPLVFLYKARYGERGQTADLWKMEKGNLDTYWRLQAERRISWVLTIVLCAFSLLKYLRRVIVVYRRKCKRNAYKVV